MSATIWFIVVGTLLVGMAISRTLLKRLPLTTSMLYLGAGVALNAAGLFSGALEPVESAALIERVTEVAVLISLFTAGLKLRAPWLDRRWRHPLRLATASMVITIGLVAVIAVVGLGFPLGAAVLLGAILAPTDPVLASDVQVTDTRDRDVVRFGLTGEAGLNDGAAFPFIMLGLGLLEDHELGTLDWRCLVVDVLWAILGGLAVGMLLGTLTARLVL